MPKYFCDYCDVFLTHDSRSVRKAHNSGRNHIKNVIDYYQMVCQTQAQSIIEALEAQRAGKPASPSPYKFPTHVNIPVTPAVPGMIPLPSSSSSSSINPPQQVSAMAFPPPGALPLPPPPGMLPIPPPTLAGLPPPGFLPMAQGIGSLPTPSLIPGMQAPPPLPGAPPMPFFAPSGTSTAPGSLPFPSPGFPMIPPVPGPQNLSTPPAPGSRR
ncbi:U1 zinc finger-domain-containing protein [Lipomyces oligophaga]|uniref:U1 zinc finger-domain-containing protein n=1 Tax=Lipomyces oligophaga TaxID=45792 RepID=UPI0034CD3A1B